ncbi:MAG: stress response translation initiation inhibitor YciH [Candidatus Woesearchaeota archaeon]|nr:MAG: stress response translation initiation inhibitor YciH [Candidatus Woesearchaeota archaeon]
MTNICNVCGLPKELCVCEQIAKESQKIIIKVVKKKFGKQYTVVEGIDTNEIDIRDVAKKLKNKLACGGTAKDGVIELQGSHLTKVQEALIELGFSPETIELK